MPDDKQPQKEQIKVTDKRIFTPDGEIREEFRGDIRPVSPAAAAPRPVEEKPPERAGSPAEPPASERRSGPGDRRGHAEAGERRRTMADPAQNPGTPFTNFLESLIAQAYMTLGMLPNPYQPQAKPDTAAARQLIDILTLLREKTAGNLTPDESDFLEAHLGELKLAYVKITKSI